MICKVILTKHIIVLLKLKLSEVNSPCGYFDSMSIVSH